MKKPFLISIILLLGATFAPISLFSQLEDFREAQPSVVPQSPNVASLMQYVDYPVSHYTGVPNISIPLYEIDCYGYKLPITLSYHASGIRVDQEASWVGLGWNLNAGGAVSRSVNGYDDFLEHKSSVFDTYIQKGYYEGPDLCDRNYIVPYYPGQWHDTLLFYYCTNCSIKYYLRVDPEPDIFYYSLPNGISGKFVLDKSRGAVLFDKSNDVKIEVFKNNGHYFVITASDGTKYVLDMKEESKNHSQQTHFNKNYTIGDLSKLDRDVSGNYTEYTSSWLLTKIILPNKREINFSYTREKITTPVQESCRKYIVGEAESHNCPYLFALKYSISQTTKLGWRLTNIEWDFGKIVFEGADRYDLNGFPQNAQRLHTMFIYDKNNVQVKGYYFNYDYFNNYYSGSYDYVMRRLKLKSVKEFNNVYQFKNYGYTFFYYEGNMPAKNSKNVDYWGYNNGSNYGANYYAVIDGQSGQEGKIKSSNFDFLKIGMLQDIYYPTLGRTTFVYEENTYSVNQISPEPTYLELPHKGAGLRIKQIISDDNKIRNFDYTNSGCLMNPPVLSHYDYQSCHGNGWREPTCIAQLSEPRLPMNSITTGCIIGYGKVIEQITDGNDTSKTQYVFYNQPEEFVDDVWENPLVTMPYKMNFYNGKPKITSHYRNKNLIQEIEYFYSHTSSQTICAFGFDPNYYISFPYNFKIDWIKKTREEITTYFSGQPVVEQTDFEYNEHFLPKKITKKLEDNKQYIKEIYYATDFTDVTNKAMTDSFMIGIPVEVAAWNNNQFIGRKRTEYALFHNKFYLPKYQRFQNPVDLQWETITQYDSYDNRGNILQIRALDNVPVNYVWDTLTPYPLSETKNGITTTFTYKPLVGMTSQTDPRGITTYFEYDIFGRLHRKKLLGDVLQEFDYHYK